jgi:hypothetical protein
VRRQPAAASGGDAEAPSTHLRPGRCCRPEATDPALIFAPDVAKWTSTEDTEGDAAGASVKLAETQFEPAAGTGFGARPSLTVAPGEVEERARRESSLFVLDDLQDGNNAPPAAVTR